MWNPELDSYDFIFLKNHFLSNPGSKLQPTKQGAKIGSAAKNEKESSAANEVGTTGGGSTGKEMIEDCIYCFRIYKTLKMKLESQKLIKSNDIETQIIPILSKMEEHGMLIDFKGLNEYKNLLKNRKKAINEEVNDMLGRRVLLSNPVDVLQVLYQDLALPRPEQYANPYKKKRPANAEEEESKKEESFWESSTKDSVIKKLAPLHKFPRLLLEYRKIKYLQSNWIDNLLKSSFQQDKLDFSVIYPLWNHVNTSTGRISSSNPNLQSLPNFSLDFVFLSFHLFFLRVNSTCY